MEPVPHTENTSVEAKAKAKKLLPWKVYLAHTLSTFGDNLWSFAGGLYMLQLDEPKSLRLTAIYGLILSATVIFFGAALGRWIDNTKRLIAARTGLVIQNTAVIVCAGLLTFYLFNPDPVDAEVWSALKWSTVVGVIFFSSVARLASSGNSIMLERDWIVVISADKSDLLAEMNSVLRTISLTSQMASPVFCGTLFSYLGYVWTGLFIAAWNVVSVLIEYTLLELIFRKYPALAKKIQDVEKEYDSVEEEESEGMVPQEEKKKLSKAEAIFEPIKHSYNAWKVYFNHPVRNAGLGLALLYMTVLGFDNITHGFILAQGVPAYVLGILTAISASFGILGSLAYPLSRG